MMNHCDHTHSVIFYIDDTDRSDLHRITDNTVYFMFQRSMWTQSSEMSTSTGTVIVHTTDMLCSSIGRHHFLVYSVRHHGVIIRCRVGTVPKVTNDVICRNPIRGILTELDFVLSFLIYLENSSTVHEYRFCFQHVNGIVF